MPGRRRQPQRPSKPTWKKTSPTEDGFYWFRNDHREPVVLHVFDPWGNGYFKAWDWDQGRLRLCEIAGYEGEWSGPLKAPE